jgi:magnesium chelatase family protein
MKVSSFVRVGHELVSAEVELTLSAGLPNFHFTGLPDVALKESALRIRAAIREQGFEVPQAHAILVHVKPTYVKKTSRGLDLAIAAALLWETGQLALPEGKTPILYGELTLKGEVVQPDDMEEALFPDGETLLTGKGPIGLPFDSYQIETLADLMLPLTLEKASQTQPCDRPEVRVPSLSESAAELAAVVAAGEHTLLVAGPAGSGKSTLVENIPALISDPDEVEFAEARKIWRASRKTLSWRPVLRPHHSITPLAMIGGGASLWPGEITRAHAGVLIMDELLEFHPQIQEALREPVESGSISLVRAGASRTYPARVLLLATTNLCACGNFVPKKGSATCRCSKQVRTKILTKLTGPFVDRFAVIALTDGWGKEKEVEVSEVRARIQRASETRLARNQKVPNARLLSEVIEESLDPFLRNHVLAHAARSRRRKAALLRVARTAADLRGAEKIELDDFDVAQRLCVETHRLLEQWRE